jgi:hypothetical protein
MPRSGEVKSVRLELDLVAGLPHVTIRRRKSCDV